MSGVPPLDHRMIDDVPSHPERSDHEKSRQTYDDPDTSRYPFPARNQVLETISGRLAGIGWFFGHYSIFISVDLGPICTLFHRVPFFTSL